jgi:hypothetical protein
MHPNLEIGKIITAVYNDGRIFFGTITEIETTQNQDVLWGDGSKLTNRTMIRIQKENGNFSSFYLDKCTSVE